MAVSSLAATLSIIPDLSGIIGESVESIHIAEALRPLHSVRDGWGLGGMTVRFVARLDDCVRDLDRRSMQLCWGQSAISGYGNASAIASDSMPNHASRSPTLASPESVEGIWVSDHGEPPKRRGLRSGVRWANGLRDIPDARVRRVRVRGRGRRRRLRGRLRRRHALAHGWPPRRRDARACRFNDLWTETHAHRRIFVQADYLTLWAKGNALPPLVTTSPPGHAAVTGRRAARERDHVDPVRQRARRPANAQRRSHQRRLLAHRRRVSGRRRPVLRPVATKLEFLRLDRHHRDHRPSVSQRRSQSRQSDAGLRLGFPIRPRCPACRCSPAASTSAPRPICKAPARCSAG